MTSTRARLPLAVVGVLGALGALALVAPSVARAAAGSWGAGAYPYVDGRVCTSGTNSSPYVSWNVNGPSPNLPAFVTEPLVSNGTTDSGAPPVASVGVGTVSTVTPGSLGFASDAEIAVYARLLATADASGDADGVAEAARAVLDKTSPGQAPFYCAADPSAALAAASATAGPYTVKLSAGSAKAIPTQANAAVATVTSASGTPVPGVQVTLTSPTAAIDNPTVRTDSSGTAQFSFRPPAGQSTPVVLQAATTAPVGLQLVQATGSASATNPTGRVVPAVLPAPGTPATSSTTVAVDDSAAPVIHARGSVGAVTVQGAVTPTAVITGLRGHSATVSFAIYGPAHADRTRGCVGAPLTTKSPVAATTTPQTVVGDRTLTAQAWTPSKAGCYAIGASLRTLDATPQASATSAPSDANAMVVVVDTTARFVPAGAVAGKGRLAGTVAVTHAGGAPVAVGGNLAGPVRPGVDGSCAKVTFAAAATTSITPARRTGDGSARLVSDPVARPGCFRWQPTVTLSFPGVDALRVPVDVANATVLVIAPLVTLTVDRSWSVSPQPVRTTVQVSGLYSARAHVAIRMVRVAQPYTGCSGVSFAAGRVLSTGPSTPIDGDGSFTVTSGATPRSGCYEPLPRLSVDGASPAVLLDADVGDPLAVINVGAAGGADGPAVDRSVVGSGSSAEVWITLIVIAGLELLTVAAVIILARRRDAAAEADFVPLRLV